MAAPTFDKVKAPSTGTRVDLSSGKFPDDPIVCLLRGDGIGRDGLAKSGHDAMKEVLDNESSHRSCHRSCGRDF